MDICIVAGARPNFIKLAPIMRAIDNARNSGVDIRHHLVYTGRQDDPTLEPSLFDDLQMTPPEVYLGVDCDNLNELTGRVMSTFEAYLSDNRADAVIVVDDLASTMAAAIVAKKQGLTLAHLVAGTRSFDINMPKEINRLVIDGLSDLLFTAGQSGSSAATREGAGQEKIYMVGNILMDTLRHNRSRLVRPALLDALALKERNYIVFTLNRKALLADLDNLKEMVDELVAIAERVPVVAPLRRRAATVVAGMTADVANVHVVDALSYPEFGYLTANALGVVTDSGNVAEEATFNGVPCITLNNYTEHAETVGVGTNVLVGEDAGALARELDRMAAGEWKKGAMPERWDGRTAERIVRILMERGGLI